MLLTDDRVTNQLLPLSRRAHLATHPILVHILWRLLLLLLCVLVCYLSVLLVLRALKVSWILRAHVRVLHSFAVILLWLLVLLLSLLGTLDSCASVVLHQDVRLALEVIAVGATVAVLAAVGSEGNRAFLVLQFEHLPCGVGLSRQLVLLIQYRVKRVVRQQLVGDFSIVFYRRLFLVITLIFVLK